MSTFLDKLDQLLNEGSSFVPTGPSKPEPKKHETNTATDPSGKNRNAPWKPNEADKGSTFLKADARRKVIERERDKKNRLIKGVQKDISKKVEKGIEVDPIVETQKAMSGHFRFSLKESFINSLMEFVSTGKKSHLNECLTLMEEYPKLKQYVTDRSKKSLPDRGFCVYSTRESSLNEKVGDPAYRSGASHKLWFLNKESAVNHANSKHDAYVVFEAKVLPTHILIYVPEFTKDIEQLIYSGKVDEPAENVVRKAKSCMAAVLSKDVESGIIVETAY